MTTARQTASTRQERATSGTRWLHGALMCLGVAVLILLMSRTVADPDLWGHLRFGQDIWAARQPVRSDAYAYTTGDQPWINHEWLAEVIMAGAYRAGGAPALIALKVLLAAGIALLIYARLRRNDLAPVRAWTVGILSAVLLAVGAGTVRPQIFTYGCLAYLLWVLLRAEEGQTRWLWTLPVLFTLWANLHGGVLAGAAILLLWLLVQLIQAAVTRRQLAHRTSRVLLVIVMSAVGSGLAMLVNPYGVELLRFLVRTATVPRPEIIEWAPITLVSPTGACYLVLLVVTTAAQALSRKSHSAFRLLAFVALAAAPIIAVRHVALFAVGAPLLASAHFADAWPRRRDPVVVRSQPRLMRLLSALFLVGALAALAASAPNFRCLRVDPDYYPESAVALLRSVGAQGNLAVHFNWGEYAIWHLAPQVRVSMDGRRETVYSPERYRDNWRFMTGAGDWDALLRNFRTDMALVPAGGATANLMRLRPGWRLLYEDKVSVLFVPEGSPLVARFQGINGTLAGPEQRECFP